MDSTLLPSCRRRLGRAAQLVVFGGPSYFRMKQGLVTNVTATDMSPYDTATFVGATIADLTQSRLGYNAGFAVIISVSTYVGVGAIARYSRATLTFQAGEDGVIEVRAGGMAVWRRPSVPVLIWVMGIKPNCARSGSVGH